MLMLLSYNLKGQNDYGFLPPAKASVIAETRSAICVPNPASDRQWDQTKSFAVQVNEAIDAENIAFGKSYPNYNHPSYNSGDALDISASILKELRRVYESDGIADLDIEYDLSVMDMATDHSCAMDLDNTFCHTCPSDGSFGARIANRIGGGCYTSGTENIAWISTEDLEQSILRIIYLMMYADVACCNNGHRENFLNCSYTNNTKIGFGIIRGDLQASSGAFIDSWIMTWDYVTYGNYPACGTGCNCNVSIGTPLCDAVAGIVLPVELSSFETQSSECDYADIHWSTLSESNHDYFEIERSVDGLAWEVVGTIVGTGDSKSLREYSYRDNLQSTSAKEVYYRLAQVDLDGNVNLSNVISFKRNCKESVISLYPNPSNNFTMINSSTKVKAVSVFDLRGRQVSVFFDQLSSRLKTQVLESGIYFLQVESVKGDISVLKLYKE